MSAFASIAVLFLSVFAYAEDRVCDNAVVDSYQWNLYAEMKALTEKTKDLAGYEACKATKDFVEAKDWPALKQKIWTDQRFHNQAPNQECETRAQLLSYEIDKLGYKSQIITVYGHLNAFLPTAEGYELFPYGKHVANLLTLKNEQGEEKQYVIDPMFTKEPLPIQAYVDLLNSGDKPRYEISSQKEVSCRYSRAELKYYEDLLRWNAVRKREDRPKFASIERGKEVVKAASQGEYTPESWQEYRSILLQQQRLERQKQEFYKRFPPVHP